MPKVIGRTHHDHSWTNELVISLLQSDINTHPSEPIRVCLD